MAIALGTLDGQGLVTQGVVLAAVAVAITVGVYGAVALIVKLDDIGLHLAGRPSRAAGIVGNGLVHAVPRLLAALSAIGTAAMLWVGGQILLHGMEELGAATLPHLVHDLAEEAADAIGFAGAAFEWLFNALGGAIAGLIVGAALVLLVHQVRTRPARPAAA